MWLSEYLNKYIFQVSINEECIKAKSLESQLSKKYCKSFRKSKRGVCQWYKDKQIANCSERCAIKQIKRPIRIIRVSRG